MSHRYAGLRRQTLASILSFSLFSSPAGAANFSNASGSGARGPQAGGPANPAALKAYHAALDAAGQTLLHLGQVGNDKAAALRALQAQFMMAEPRASQKAIGEILKAASGTPRAAAEWLVRLHGEDPVATGKLVEIAVPLWAAAREDPKLAGALAELRAKSWTEAELAAAEAGRGVARHVASSRALEQLGRMLPQQANAVWELYGAVSETQILALHHAVFKQDGSLLALLQSWRETSADPRAPAQARQTLAFLIKALSAPNLDTAGRMIFGAAMDRAPQLMAAEIALEFWGAMFSDKRLASELSRAKGELWGQAAAPSPEQRLGEHNLEASTVFPALETALHTWRPGAQRHRLLELSPAAEAWRSYYAAELGLDKPLSAVAPDADGESSPSAAVPASGRGGFARGKRRQKQPQAGTEEASDRVPMSEVMVGIFDADDNLWINVNAVWVFKKGTAHGEQVPVYSKEWAEEKKKIGQKGAKYADYEIWHDAARGSYREFRDQEGFNPLVKNMKQALKERPLSDILGQSWDAFVHMLKVNPKGVYILTASGLSRENFMAGLEVLKEEGLIPELPPLENIHCVGHPKHPYHAAMSESSEAKLMVAADIADGQQARAEALRGRMPRLLDHEGKRLKEVLPIGFSDDDPDNYSIMRDGLKRKMREKPKRWADLKWTLFHTDPDEGPDTGAWVLKPDGSGEREVTADEYSETFVEGVDQEQGSGKAKRVPVPEIKRVRESFAQAIERVYFTVDAPVTHPKVKTGVEQVALEAQALREHIRAKLPKGARKSFIAERYTLGEAVIAEVLEEAVDAGVPGDLVWDLNTVLEPSDGFKPGEPYIPVSADLSRFKIKDGSSGEMFRRLLAKGWRVNDPKARWRIISQPLYDHTDDSMDPIMHRKKLILVSVSAKGKREYRYLASTGNWSNKGQRVNLVIETRLPAIVEHAIKNSERQTEAFLAGKPINQVRSARPRKILFDDGKSGDSLFMGYTDGRYNLNDLYTQAVARTVEDPENYKLVAAGLFHFAATYGPGFEMLLKALDLHKEAWLRAVFDGKFSTQRGWGRSPMTGGHYVLKPRGMGDLPWPWRVRQRVEAYSYQRGIPGVLPEDLEGPPNATFVYHLKLSLARILERDKLRDKIAWGSFNFSGKFTNAEFLWFMDLDASRGWYEVFEGLALGHARNHRDEWAIPMWRGPWRDTAARLIGHSPLEVPLLDLAEIEKAAKEKRLTSVGFLLQNLLAGGTTLKRDTLPPAAAQKNILRYLKLVGFYAEMAAGSLKGILSPLTAQRASMAALTLAYKDNSAYDIKAVLRSLFWEMSLTREQVARLVDLAWQAVGFDEHLKEMEALKAQEKQAQAGEPGA